MLGPRQIVLSLSLVSALAGAAGGIALDRAGLLPFLPRAERHHGPRGPHGGFSRMFAKLDLDAEQEKQVRAILDARRPRFEAVMADVKPRMQQLREETDREIRALLRPDQLARFDALKAEIASVESNREAGRGPQR